VNIQPDQKQDQPQDPEAGTEHRQRFAFHAVHPLYPFGFIVWKW
jgi:hypothetical protein